MIMSISPCMCSRNDFTIKAISSVAVLPLSGYFPLRQPCPLTSTILSMLSVLKEVVNPFLWRTCCLVIKLPLSESRINISIMSFRSFLPPPSLPPMSSMMMNLSSLLLQSTYFHVVQTTLSSSVYFTLSTLRRPAMRAMTGSWQSSTISLGLIVKRR